MTNERHDAATLEVRGLHANVEGKPILRGIDLTVRQGEIHALMGPNGSGKSTLSNVIMGRPGYVVTEGQVLLNGEDITQLTRRRAGQARPVPGDAVPDRDPRRVGRELPADGLPVDQGRADLARSRSAST